MSSTPSTSTTFQGTQRFQVLGPLGVGAMCVVHRARDRELGDVVALKTLKHLDSDSLYRLKQEFRALSAFDHPNLVSFYELLHSSDGWFVTMELVEGVDYLSWSRGKEEGDLSRARTMNTYRSATDLRFGRSAPGGAALEEDNAVTEVIEALPELRLPDLLRLRSTLRQLADGVSALHAGGRIHRDLKPSNVLVNDAGRVVILDFGLVADINQDYTEGTLHQSIAGSAAYMSPEQAIGSPLTEAADWYAVGVMLYEALTGRWPFSGSLYQILTQKNAMDPASPADLLDGVPPDLNDLCMALLQRDPEARPSGGEVLAALRHQEPGRAAPKLLVPFRFRDDELATLRAAQAHCQQGRPAAVLVRGASGSGRTQLVREFVKELNKAGVITLKGRCYEWERVPYKALDGLMDNLARAMRRAPLEIVRALSNEDLSWLAALFPVMARADALDILPADPSTLPREELVQRAFAQLGRMFDALARERPVMLFIDDVQWGDLESAQALAQLMTEQPARKLLLVVTVETGTQSPFLTYLLPRLAQARVGSATIEVGPLDLRASALLAAAMLGQPVESPDVLSVANASGGLPGNLRELVRQRVTASSQDDETVLDAVRIADIAGLPLPPRRLLELLAVAGGPVPTEVAVVASQLGDQAVNAVSTLRAHRLADVSGAAADALEIGSRIVMDYVVDRTPESVRQSHHKALAKALEQTGQADPLVLAAHYAGAGDPQRAGTVAWLAANRALEGGDWGRAIPLLDIALEHGRWTPRERVAMLATAARTHGLVGQVHEASALLAKAIDGAPEISKPTLQRQQAEQWLTAGNLAEADPMLAILQEQAGLAAFPRGILSGGMTAWRRFQQRRRGQSFDSKLRTDVDPDALHKVDVAWSCVGPLAVLDPERAWSYQPVHLTTALDVGEVERVMRALCEEVVIQVARELGADRAPLQRVDELARTHRSPLGSAYLASATARIAWLSGDVGATISASAEAEKLLRRMARPVWQRQGHRLDRVSAQAVAGQIDAAAAEVDQLARRARHNRNARQLVEVLGRLGPVVAAAKGQGAALHDALAPMLDKVSAPRTGGWGVLAMAQLDLLGEVPDRALARLSKQEERVSTAFADPWLRSRWWHTRGLAARGTGDAREATRLAALLRKDDRPWAGALADAIDGNYDRSGPQLRALGMGLETALHGIRANSAGADAAWLREKGATDVDGLLRMLT